MDRRHSGNRHSDRRHSGQCYTEYFSYRYCIHPCQELHTAKLNIEVACHQQPGSQSAGPGSLPGQQLSTQLAPPESWPLSELASHGLQVSATIIISIDTASPLSRYRELSHKQSSSATNFVWPSLELRRARSLHRHLLPAHHRPARQTATA